MNYVMFSFRVHNMHNLYSKLLCLVTNNWFKLSTFYHINVLYTFLYKYMVTYKKSTL